MRSIPARPSTGAWPSEMRIDLAASFFDYDTTGKFVAAIERGEAPRATSIRTFKGRAIPVSVSKRVRNVCHAATRAFRRQLAGTPSGSGVCVMRKIRSSLPLPRYTERRWSKKKLKWTYLFNVPSWAKQVEPGDPRGPCLVKSEALGDDYHAAVHRVETILLPQFDSWRTSGLVDLTPRGPAPGTFDWLVGLYRKSPQYRNLTKRMKINFEYGLNIASSLPLKSDKHGRTKFGQLSLKEITPGVADKLYAKVKFDEVPIFDKNGSLVIEKDGTTRVLQVPRLRRAQEVIKACRRAWKVAYRQEPNAIPISNPFEQVEVQAPKAGKTVPATWEQTLAFVKACDDAGYWSIGTAALVSFLWFQREEHIMGVPREDNKSTGLLWTDYRPEENPDCVIINHPKTDEIVPVPLYSEDGDPLFPELMERLDNAPKRGTLICLRDHPDKTGVYRPWPTHADNAALAVFIRRVGKIRDAAGLPKEITFRSFRHGGFTATGDADLSNADVNAVAAKTEASIDIYRRGTIDQRRRAFMRLLDQRSKQKRMSTKMDKTCPPEANGGALSA